MIKYRFDLVFSYWIFLWFLFYYFGKIKSSPKLALIFALCENIFMILYIVYTKSVELIKRKYVVYFLFFLIVNFFIKVFPIYLLRNEKINWKKDFENIIFIVSIYLLWVFINSNIFKIKINEIIKNMPLTMLFLGKFS